MAEFEQDPLRLLPQDVPRQYLGLPAEEKAWRGRYFLMALSMGAGVEYAWVIALTDEPTHNREAHALVTRTADQEIIEAMRTRNAPGRVELPWDETEAPRLS